MRDGEYITRRERELNHRDTETQRRKTDVRRATDRRSRSGAGQKSAAKRKRLADVPGLRFAALFCPARRFAASRDAYVKERDV
jgi:hypothetical protein